MTTTVRLRTGDHRNAIAEPASDLHPGKPQRFIRFRTKLMILFFLVVCLSVTMVGGVYYFRMSSELEKNTYASLERLAGQTVESVEWLMESVRKEAWSYFSDTDLQQFVANMNNEDFFQKSVYFRNRLETTLYNDPRIAMAALYDLDGNMLVSGSWKSPLANIRKMQREEEEMILRLAGERQGAGTWIVTRTLAGSGRSLVRTLSYVQTLKLITTTSQKPVGVIQIELRPGWLKEQLRLIRMEEEGAFYIADRQGTVLMAEHERDIGRSLADEAMFQAYRSASKTRPAGPMIGHVTVVVEGKRYLGVYAEFDSEDWVLIGSVPQTAVLEGAVRARRETVTIGAVSLAAAMALAFIVSSRVTRPLNRLRLGMKQIESGRLDVEVPVNSRDEIGILASGFNRMAREIRSLIAKVYETELLKKEAEILALQSQINPHFLYNALGTIDSMAAIHNDPRISVISSGLASMFRYSVSGGQTADAAEEIRQIELYLAIQQVRYGDRLSCSVELEPELAGVRMPKLLLQPIVENAFVHGIERKRGPVHVRVAVSSLAGNRVCIIVEDNGAGMDADRLQRLRCALDRVQETAALNAFSRIYPDSGSNRSSYRSSDRSEQGKPPLSEPMDPAGHPGTDDQRGRKPSIGLVNVKRRLLLFYGHDCTMEIASRPGEGTKVILTMPAIRGESACSE